MKKDFSMKASTWVSISLIFLQIPALAQQKDISVSVRAYFKTEKTGALLVMPDNQYKLTTIRVYYEYSRTFQILRNQPLKDSVVLSGKERLMNVAYYLPGERKALLKVKNKSIVDIRLGTDSVLKVITNISPQNEGSLELRYTILSPELKQLRQVFKSDRADAFEIEIPECFSYRIEGAPALPLKGGEFELLQLKAPEKGAAGYVPYKLSASTYKWTRDDFNKSGYLRLLLSRIDFPREWFGTSAEELMKN